MEQWQRFVDGLSPEVLFDEASKANSVGFVSAMLEEGYSAEEVSQCLTMFARRFVTLGQMAPQGGYLDLVWLGMSAAAGAPSSPA